MLDKGKIKTKIKENLAFMEQEYQVKRLSLFGSVARGDQRKGSDINLLVEFKKPISLFDFVRLERFLEKILDQEVDLGSKKALKAIIKDRVLEEAESV